MKKFFVYILPVILMSLALCACEDEIPFDGGEIPEGTSRISATLTFETFEPTLESRAAGNAMRQINDLWLVIFSGDELFRKERVDLSKATISQVTNSRPDTDEHCTEQTTRVEFEYTLPNGRYRIYAVANVDLSDKDIRTQGDLQHIRLVWNNDPGQINSNAQMIGYFTADRSGGTASFSTVSGDEKTGYEETGALEADEITVRASTSLHAWVRRAASKITVAFDTRDLRENIYIYIKSVTVKDIPEDCYLGASNTPGALNRAEGMSNGLVDGETVYFGKADASQTDHKAHYNKWMRLTKGDVLAGLYSNANGKYGENVSYDERYAKEHSDEVPALYFYENLQGLGQEGTPSDKRQDVSGNNSQVTYPGGNNPDNEAFKDAKRKGSYVEVEAYYICEDSRNPGQGPITYRFMLGKDTKTDYNAERNHHYKLTLKFNGYANDIDWHIVYKKEDSPGLQTPDFYVSYLNNVDATTIVRATPRPGYKVSKLTAVIIDNEWRPHDNGSGFVEEYNEEAWDWSVNGKERYGVNINKSDLDDSESARNVCFGFLSLRNPGTTERIDFGGAASLNSQGVDNLIKGIRDNFYKSNIHGGKSLGKREYTQIPQDVTGDNGQTYDEGANGNYSVLVKKAWLENGLETKDYIFTIPVYTRPKTLDSWGVFSGCNQNTNNYRYARVKYIAEYEPLPGVAGEKYSDTSYANCYQSQRIDNPVGVYRNYDNTDAFNITMMYAQGSGFQAVESRGPWSVTIETDPDGLVELSYRGKTVSGQGASLTGQTGTNVTFSYRPRGTVGIEGSRGAVLRVLYHNYSCYHLIVVRQGYAPVDLHESTRWSSFNLFDSETLCKNPLTRGSLFRRNADRNHAILANNNSKPGLGYGQNPGPEGKFNVHADGVSKEEKWTEIPYLPLNDARQNNAFGEFTMTNPMGKTYTYAAPTRAQYHSSIRDASDVGCLFGIVYGDGALETKDNSDAYSFTDYDNNTLRSPKGVQGMIAYHKTSGHSIFFSFGAAGHARRKNSSGNGYGLMRYGSVDTKLSGANSSTNAAFYYRYNNYRPLAYNLPEQKGGVYWLRDFNLAPSSTSNNIIAMDFNSGNYMVNELGTQDLYTGSASDACCIRPVHVR